MMNRLMPIVIGFIGALLGVSVVIGGMYILLEYTDILADPLAEQTTAAQPVPASDVDETGLPPVVLTVNGEAITREMVQAEVKISRLNIAAPLPPLTGEDLMRAQNEAINQLVTRHLILQAAAKDNFVMDDETVEQRVNLLFGSYGDEALDQALQDIGATRADVEWWVREIFTVEDYTTDVIMADAAPEARQVVYNNWMNFQRNSAHLQSFRDGDDARLQALVGSNAPDFTLMTPDGQAISLADYRGKVVFVNFWATWCPSCVAEMPEYEQVYQKHGQGQGDLVVLGVNLQEGPEHVTQYAAGLGVTFPVLLDEDGNVTGGQYQATGMPASVIVDRQGNIFYRHLGPMSGATLEAKLAELGL